MSDLPSRAAATTAAVSAANRRCAICTKPIQPDEPVVVIGGDDMHSACYRQTIASGSNPTVGDLPSRAALSASGAETEKPEREAVLALIESARSYIALVDGPMCRCSGRCEHFTAIQEARRRFDRALEHANDLGVAVARMLAVANPLANDGTELTQHSAPDTDASAGEICIANYDEWREFQAWRASRSAPDVAADAVEQREVYSEGSVRLLKQLAEQRREEPLDTDSAWAANTEIIGLCETVEALRAQLRTARAALDEARRDSVLLDLLDSRRVVSIYFADRSQLNPGSQSLRAALSQLYPSSDIGEVPT